MIGMACPYRKSEHRVVHPRFLEWLKRKVPDARLRDSLFVYFHLTHKTIVIAQWIVPCRSFIDIHNLGYSYASFTPEVGQNIVAQLKNPVSGTDLVKALREREYRRLVDKQDQNDSIVEQRTRKSRIMASVP